MNHYALLNLYCPLSISPSLQLDIAAGKRQHSWDWSHLSEIYPGWSLGAQEGHRRPAQSQCILLGLVAWQHWLIGLAGLRKGLARAGGIRSLPLIIFPLHSSESWGHGHKKLKPCHHVWEGVITHTGEQRDAWQALCGCLLWHLILHITRRDAATTHGHMRCDCNWRPAFKKAGLVLHRQGLDVWKRSCNVLTYYQIL